MTTAYSGDGITFPDASVQATAPKVGMVNRIINGGMVVDQRNAGASVTLAGSTYLLDRWRVGYSSTAVMSFQQVADAPAGFTHSLLSTVVTSSATASGNLFYLQQNIEGFNVSDFGFGTVNAQPITASFWVKSSLTGLKSFSFINGAINRAYGTTYNIVSANTWEYKTITVPGDTTGTWETNNGTGIELHFNFAIGSTYQATLGSWSNGRTYTDATTPQFATTAGATINITGVQLEKGSTATDFEYVNYSQQLQMCQRYAFATNGSNGIGGVGDTTSRGQQFIVPEMRATPTLTTLTAGSVNMTDGYTSTHIAANATFTLSHANPDFARVNIGGFSGLTSGRWMSGLGNGTAVILFSAEL